jgi:hypothetical protein
MLREAEKSTKRFALLKASSVVTKISAYEKAWVSRDVPETECTLNV